MKKPYRKVSILNLRVVLCGSFFDSPKRYKCSLYLIVLKFELTKLNACAIIFLNKERGFPPIQRGYFSYHYSVTYAKMIGDFSCGSKN